MEVLCNHAWNLTHYVTLVIHQINDDRGTFHAILHQIFSSNQLCGMSVEILNNIRG